MNAIQPRPSGPVVPLPETAGENRLDAGLALVRELDAYKLANRQHGAVTATVNYGDGGRLSVALSDTCRIKPGTPVEVATPMIVEWLREVLSQESDVDIDGHQFAVQVEISGQHGCVLKARQTRTRTDGGPAMQVPAEHRGG